MDDLFIDFAGIKPEQHPARLALLGARAGNALQIEKRGNHIELVNKDGVSCARLSRKAQSDWAGRLHGIQEVRVVAMVRRYREDVADKAFQAACFGDAWEVPIVEVVC